MRTLTPFQTAVDHLRLDDADEEGAYVEMLVTVAESSVAQYLGRPLTPWSDDQVDPPPEVMCAVLLILADLYENRCAQTDKPLSSNATVDRLLHFHRMGLGL